MIATSLLFKAAQNADYHPQDHPHLHISSLAGVRNSLDLQAYAEREIVLLCLGWRQGREGCVLFRCTWSSIRSVDETRRAKHAAVELRGSRADAKCQVQSGGSFDIDYRVIGPYEKIVLDGSKERQGDFVFTANDEGEYRFCFDNEMSTVTDKVVDFEISVRLAHGMICANLPLSRPIA